MITFTVALSGASEPPGPGECEETRRELVGGHPLALGHRQGEQHEAAEAEEGGHIFSNNMEIYFPIKWKHSQVIFHILDFSFRRR